MEIKNWRTLVQWSRNSFNLGIFFNICFLTVKIVIQFAGLLEKRIDPTRPSVMGLLMRMKFPFSDKCPKILFIGVIVSEHDCSVLYLFSWISFRTSARLLHSESLFSNSGGLNNFERVIPIPYNTRLRKRWTPYGGLQYDVQCIIKSSERNDWIIQWLK